ncbi:MAG: hypothetical protein Q9171_007293 [Xanthocarpia ochracea]
MGYSTLSSQALSAPPYLMAFLVVLVTALYSDRYRNRSLFICFHALLASSGYAMIAIAGVFKAGPMWRYWGVYPAASQLGPFIGTALYPEKDKPYYVHGMAACAGFMLLVAALSLWLRWILQKKNEIAESTTYSVICGEEDNDESPDEDGKLVEKTNFFRYML